MAWERNHRAIASKYPKKYKISWGNSKQLKDLYEKKLDIEEKNWGYQVGKISHTHGPVS